MTIAQAEIFCQNEAKPFAKTMVNSATQVSSEMMLAFCIFTAHKKSDLDEVSNERGDEHVVQSVVLVVQNVLETSAAAEGHQDADVAGLDARAKERDQVVVTKFTHLVNKGAFTSLESSLIPF